MNPIVKSFFHNSTNTWTHVVNCPKTKVALIIDPVLDYNANNGSTSTKFIDNILSYCKNDKLKLVFVLETHAHADHITSAKYITDNSDAQIGIGKHIQSVQETFKRVFNFDDSFKTDGSQFNLLFNDGDSIPFGSCQLNIMHTPGHTDDSICYIVGDCVFIGDTLFSPDYGTARCDFPGGSAEKLYDSIQNIYSLGENKKLYLCHDYPPTTRAQQAWFSSLDQQQNNIHVNKSIDKESFVILRNKRDSNLNHPKLIIPAIQVNIKAGKFPQAESNGKVYLKIPLNVLRTKQK